MSKLTNLAAGLAVVPMLAISTPALANSGIGQIEQGNIYRVKNASLNGTDNGNFADTIGAQCGETVAFRVMVHNTGPDAITNVKVAATLDGSSVTNHASKVTITADNAHGMTVTDTAGVTTDKATTISYVNGSTELLDVNGNKISSLADGITNGGLNIGTVGPLTSDTRDVQFEAMLNCVTPPTPPAPVQIQVCDLATKQIVTINESDFNSSKYTKDLTQCKVTPVTPTTPTTPATPTTLVNTGAGSVAGIFAAVAAVAAVASQVVLRRRQARADSN